MYRSGPIYKDVPFRGASTIQRNGVTVAVIPDAKEAQRFLHQLNTKCYIGVGVALIYGEWILLGKRGSKCRSGVGCWALPGGYCEQGESPEQTAHREILEETGLNMDGSSVRYVTYLEKTQVFTIWMMGSLLEFKSPQVLEPDKCEEWRWMNWKEIVQVSQENDDKSWIPLNLWEQMFLSYLR